MEKKAKLGTVLIAIGAILNFTAFFVGVNAGGVILMALAITLVGYGAGSIMDTPCNLVKK
jgi:hypothetical protein